MSFSPSYRKIVAEHPNSKIWHQPNFLEALTSELPKDKWEVFEYLFQGELIAVQPFCFTKRKGLNYVYNPLFYKYTSPLFIKQEISESLFSGYYTALINWLKSKADNCSIFLSPCDFENQHTHIPFKSRYTYYLDLKGSPEDILNRCQKRFKRKIKKAENFFTLEQVDLGQIDLEMTSRPFTDKGLETPYSLQTITSCYKALKPTNQISCLRAYTPDRELAASFISIYDKHFAYSWLMGSRKNLSNTNAGTYIHYQAILEAQRRGYSHFDFLGSMLPGIEENRIRFGGIKQWYCHYENAFSIKGKLAKFVNEKIKKARKS